jgi:hypothetical protein
LNGGQPREFSGKELRTTGIPITIPQQPGAAVLVYKKKP